MTTEPPLNSRLGRLELNARGHRHDPQMEEAARLWREDRDHFDRLSPSIKSQMSVYIDLKRHYDDAVRAGAVPDDRGPNTAEGLTP